MIRKASLNDYNQISKLVSEVHQLHVLNRPDVYLDLKQPFSYDSFLQLLEEPTSNLFVIENSNQNLIGYGIINLLNTRSLTIMKPSTIAYIDDFCISSSYQHQGYGAQLFDYLKEYAKEQGATSLQLTVWEFNEPAIAFYEKMGMSTRNRRLELPLK